MFKYSVSIPICSVTFSHIQYLYLSYSIISDFWYWYVMIFANHIQFSLCLRLQYSIYSFDLIWFYFLQCGASVPMSFTCTASWSGSTHSRSTSSVRCAGRSGSSRSEDGDSSEDSFADSSADSSADSATVKDNSGTWWTLVLKRSLPFVKKVKKIYHEMDEKLAPFRTTWMFLLPSLTQAERDSHTMKCLKSMRHN